MVWQQALYLVNLLCKFVPCDYTFPYPDTSLSEPQAFKNLITLGFDENGNDDPQPHSLGFGIQGGWGDPKSWLTGHQDYTKTDPLVVITKSGKLRGFWMRVVGGRKIRAYEGIPFAEPPLGYFRFHPPAPKIAWSGLFHADKKGPKCLQFGQVELHRVVGDEDCLFLNIYAPQLQTGPGRRPVNTTKFAVLVFIHGGGFQVGSGNDFGPSYLLQQDLILVTLNWRVGVLGFMSTGDSSSSGNYGLKDQYLGIKWVYDNIEYFNGDPSRITLIGHEAGAASVHIHMMSPKTQKYFSAGVSMSGTAFNPWVFHEREKAKDLTKHFAKKCNCPVHSSEAIVSCLRRVDAHQLAKVQMKFLDDWPLPIYLFRPVIEVEDMKQDPYVTITPEEAYAKDLVSKVPWITGFCEDEGLTFLLPTVFRGTMKLLRSNWNHIAADFLDLELLNVDLDDITRKINWLYFKQHSPLTASVKVFSDALSSRYTITGAHKALQAHCQKAPTYGYMFSFNGKYNLATMAGIKPHEWGVGQGEDVFYLLNSTTYYQGFQKMDSETILSKIMVNLFGNFATKRYPTFTMENHEDFQIWHPITDPRNMSFLMIQKKIKMIPEPYLKQTIYWESLGLPDTMPFINSSEHFHHYNHHVGFALTTAAPEIPQGSYIAPQPNLYDVSESLTPTTPVPPIPQAGFLPPTAPSEVFLVPPAAFPAEAAPPSEPFLLPPNPPSQLSIKQVRQTPDFFETSSTEPPPHYVFFPSSSAKPPLVTADTFSPPISVTLTPPRSSLSSLLSTEMPPASASSTSTEPPPVTGDDFSPPLTLLPLSVPQDVLLPGLTEPNPSPQDMLLSTSTEPPPTSSDVFLPPSTESSPISPHIILPLSTEPPPPVSTTSVPKLTTTTAEPYIFQKPELELDDLTSTPESLFLPNVPSKPEDDYFFPFQTNDSDDFLLSSTAEPPRSTSATFSPVKPFSESESYNIM